MADLDEDDGWIQGVRDGLLGWYGEAKRPLPWRANRDPYRILVSEMMLVQTTAAAVAPHFERFLREFPDFRSLADAEEDAVVKAWEGLGYYRRARQLHEAARRVAALHGGAMPDDPSAVRALPGVGRYMAGAILSQAFNLPEPILEANSQRVLARLLAWEGDLKSSATAARLWRAAARLVPSQSPGEFNQALMELGALICTPRAPRCLVCPVSAHCEARRLGLQNVLPKVAPRPAPLAVREACAVVALRNEVLVVRREAPGLWAGFWEFPTVHLEGADPAGRSFDEPVDLAEGVRRLTGVAVQIGDSRPSLRYTVTRHRVVLEVHRATPRSGAPAPAPGAGFSEARWVKVSKLADLTLSAAGRRLASSIVAEPPAWGLDGPILQ